MVYKCIEKHLVLIYFVTLLSAFPAFILAVLEVGQVIATLLWRGGRVREEG